MIRRSMTPFQSWNSKKSQMQINTVWLLKTALSPTSPFIQHDVPMQPEKQKSTKLVYQKFQGIRQWRIVIIISISTEVEIILTKNSPVTILRMNGSKIIINDKVMLNIYNIFRHFLLGILNFFSELREFLNKSYWRTEREIFFENRDNFFFSSYLVNSKAEIGGTAYFSVLVSDSFTDVKWCKGKFKKIFEISTILYSRWKGTSSFVQIRTAQE